nr:integrase, catalytic region, zinc finger, CCHC-type, peptidase aspartic, catalytic [Tanacetum cinerariifolium]
MSMSVQKVTSTQDDKDYKMAKRDYAWELKQIEADDQVIQTILLGLPEDIYAAVDSCETAQEIWLRVQQMMKGSDIGIQEKKANQNGVDMLPLFIRLRTCTQLIKLNSNFIKPKEQADCLTGYEYGSTQINADDWRSGIQNQIGNGNPVVARAEGNAAGQNVNQIRCYNCKGFAEEYDLMAAAADLDEIKKVNANYILMANLQQASSSGTQTDSAPVYDSDGSAEFMETVRFGNDHVAAILGFSDLQWENILITRVYFVEGLGHNLFSVGQFYDSDLEVAFRRNACFVRNLEGVDLLKGDRSTNLYTINLHEMASASPICLMARASSTKSWLWHQRLSHLNFDTINDLARNDLAVGLPKFKYHKEHLCPSCEQGKIKRASHPPKPVPNSRQRSHLLHMDLCGPMRIASINGKRYILVIVDDYSRYTWRLLLRVSLKIAQLFTVDSTIPYELINGRKPDISFLYVFGALCYPKNDREDIGKLGAKGDIGFFIGYSADSCAYRIYNHRTKKIMETMIVSFDELSAMAFEQRSSKPGL